MPKFSRQFVTTMAGTEQTPLMGTGSSSSSSPQNFVSPFLPQPPSVTCTSFFSFKHHLHLDFQVASWLLFVASVLYLAVMAYYYELYSSPGIDDDAYTFVVNSFIVFLTSAVVYLLASLIFLYYSYPSNLWSMMKCIQEYDDKKAGFLENYFTANPLLISTLLFAFGSLPFLIYPIWAYDGGYIDTEYFVVYFLIALLVLGVVFLLVISSFPFNLAKNEGRGSSYFFDLLCPFDVCCDGKDLLRKNLSPDFLAGALLLCILSIAFIPVACYLLYLDSEDWVSYVWLFSSLSLAAGSIVLFYASYPDHRFQSTLVWSILTWSWEWPKPERDSQERRNS